MSDFFSFLKSNRAKVGFVDFYDLSEIYEADQKTALRNLLLDPDALDQIYSLSRTNVSKEDIRTAGGLDKSVINSLALSYETLPGVSSDILKQIRTDSNIGEPSKQSDFTDEYSDNIIVFHGGIAANNIEYNFIDENGDFRTTTVPTSRESLFSSLKDNSSRITDTFYPSLFRARRRSHAGKIKLRESMLLSKENIIESPTHTVTIPVYMHTPTTTNPDVTPLKCYATKNSPVTIPLKLTNSGSFSIKRSFVDAVSETPFVFGWELRRKSDGLLILSEVGPSRQGQEFLASFSVVGTLAQGANCELIIYLDPLQVEELDLNGLGIEEDSARDLGLVGFNSLKVLKIGGNGLTTLPVWLKTLNSKLEYLDISENPHWNNGVIPVFDYQDLRGSGIEGISEEEPPSLTATQVLSYSGYLANGSRREAYTGVYNTISDGTNLYKDLRKNKIDNLSSIDVSEAQGFRIFTNLKELHVGSSVPFINADFSKIFPNLENFRAPTDSARPKVLKGLLPKFNNNNQPITVNYWGQQNLGGTINYMGDTLTWTDDIASDPESTVAKQFIGQFRVKEFLAFYTNIRGGFLTGPDDVNSVSGRYHVESQANVAQAWSGWLENLGSIVLGYFSRACLKLASGTSLNWKNLAYVSTVASWSFADEAQVVLYNASVSASSEVSDDILVANTLYQAHLYESGIYGRLFSIKEAPKLTLLQVGGNDLVGYGDGEYKYLLPSNFVDPALPNSFEELHIPYIKSAWDKNLTLRQDDFKNLPKLKIVSLAASQVYGKFPTIYNDSEAGSVVFSNIDIRGCNFRDMSSMGSSNTRRVKNISFSNQSTYSGGAMMPNFTAPSNDILESVDGENSLSSSYPSEWFNTTNAGKVMECLITNTIEENEIPGVTWTRDSADPDRLFADRVVWLHYYIMTGDEIFYNSVKLGEVTQLHRNGEYIYAKGSGITNIPTSGGVQLVFRRKGQNISAYFEQHKALKSILLGNNRLTGSMPKFTNCNKILNLDLSNNLFTNYQLGTLGPNCLLGTSGEVFLKTFKLNNNPLSYDSIRKIIKDLYDFAVLAIGRNYNIYVNLSNTYWSSSTKTFRNWEKSEIFNNSTIIVVPDPTPTEPNRTRTEIIPDAYETYFNRLGPGNMYPNIKIELF